jgi:hypothetical protein
MVPGVRIGINLEEAHRFVLSSSLALILPPPLSYHGQCGSLPLLFLTLSSLCVAAITRGRRQVPIKTTEKSLVFFLYISFRLAAIILPSRMRNTFTFLHIYTVNQIIHQQLKTVRTTHSCCTPVYKIALK